jgi:hypothetical protein
MTLFNHMMMGAGSVVATYSSFFKPKIYNGNGSTQSITGAGFSVDLVWGKNRGYDVNNIVTDRVRGATKSVHLSSANAEQTSSVHITSLDADGFSVGQCNSGTGDVNYYNGQSYSAWMWDEGSGLDIITGTKGSGTQAFAHSLGVKPAVVLVKNLSTGSTNWYVQHKSLGAEMRDYYIILNGTAGATNSNDVWGTEPTSTNIYLTESQVTNGSSFVAYAFAELTGASAFGTFNGNNSSQSITTGFVVNGLMIRRSDATGGNWLMYDSARGGTYYLKANSSGAETNDGSNYVTFSGTNGFSVTGSAADLNATGGTYIYMAFA